MAILRSVDGKFYEVPDGDLDQYLIPEDQVKQKLDEAGCAPAPAGGPPGPGGPATAGPGGPGVTVQIITAGGGPGGPGPGRPPGGQEGEAVGAGAGGEVTPYGWCCAPSPWNNFWHNCWRNNWRNYWHNCY